MRHCNLRTFFIPPNLYEGVIPIVHSCLPKVLYFLPEDFLKTKLKTTRSRVRCGGGLMGCALIKRRKDRRKLAESRHYPTNFRELQSAIEVRLESSTAINIPHIACKATGRVS